MPATFLRFARLHTIVATALQVVGLFIIAGGRPSDWSAVLLALFSCLAANVYIVGLNQITDVDIDRINKPELPLASGELSRRAAIVIVAICGVTAVLLAATQSIYLLATVLISLLVGTLYSLPPRWKERPFLAALSIALVRGFVANVGLFLHFHQTVAPDTAVPWPYLGAIALFFFGYGLVIALFKDIPDLAGDRRFDIRTFAVRLGPGRIFDIGRWVMTGFYVAPIVALAPGLPRPGSLVMLFGHGLLLALFWGVSRRILPADPASMRRFYLFFWGLFYAEYILLSLYAVAGGNGDLQL